MTLARGLNYTLPPAKLKKGSYLANFEVLFDRLKGQLFLGSNDDKLHFKNQLRDYAFSSLYNFKLVRKILCNIPPEEMKALKSLAPNKGVVFMKPDKGTGVVILNMSDYINKVERIVSDQSKFMVHKNQDLYKISRSIETKVRNYLCEHVKKPGHISEDEYRRLYPNGSHIGVMYGLLKVHKQNYPVRPVCSAVGTSTYQLSKYVGNIIKPAAGNVNGTDLNDTFQFVKQVNEL